MILVVLSEIDISNVMCPNKYTYSHKTRAQTYLCSDTETTADYHMHTYSFVFSHEESYDYLL